MEDKIIASGVYFLMSVFYPFVGVLHLVEFLHGGRAVTLVIGVAFVALTPHSIKQLRNSWAAGLSSPASVSKPPSL